MAMFQRDCPSARREKGLTRAGLLGIVVAGTSLLAAPVARGASYSWQVQSGNWSVASNWGGTLPSNSDTACVANGGTVNVTVSETCGALSLGNGEGSGTVQMTGGGLSAGTQYVGVSGTGTFSQSGGTNASYANLYLGYNAGSSGTYSLSSSGLLVGYSAVAAYVYVGYSGTGTFTQSGGTSTVGGYPNTLILSLGYNTGSNGTYSLSGGQLSASDQEVGLNGTGTFLQSGGSNAFSTLDLGAVAGGSGTYNLSGSGQVSAVAEWVGSSGTGTFTQSGGTNSGSILVGYNAGSSGTYSLSGSGLFLGGADVGLSGAGAFRQSGGTNTSSGNLTLGDDSGGNGTYSLSGNGLLLVPNYGIEQVGYNGTGTFTQSGGTNNTNSGDLVLGENTGSNGAYNLSGSGLLTAGTEYLGSSGTGTFTQSGGTNSIAGELSLAGGEGNSGTSPIGSYNLSGSGFLSAGNEYVGAYAGTGTFTQSGGTNITAGLNLGLLKGTRGTYNLNGGLLVLSSLSQGSGAAAFNFSGGTLQASGSFATSLPMTLGASSGGATFDTTGYSVTLSGSLSGPGSLTKVNNGTLILAASNSYTGTTTILGGVLSLANSAALAGRGNITFAGGSLQYSENNTQDYSGRIVGSTAPISIDTNGTNVTFASSLVDSNIGGLTKIDSGALTLAAADAFSGNTLVSNGTLVLGNSLALQNSTLDTSGSGTLSFGILTTAALGGLTGPGALDVSNATSSAVTLSVGDNNASTTYSGILSGPGSLTKVGSGELELTDNNTYTGPTTNNAGKLIVNGSLVSPVTVNSGVLGGTGTLSTVTISPSGAIAPGSPLGTLTLSGSLVLSSGAMLDYDLDRPSTSEMIDCGPVVASSLGFSNFSFESTSNFRPGVYDLIYSTNTLPSGVLGGSTSGSIDGYPASLAVSGNELVLTVVPEPGTLSLLLAGTIGLGGCRWRWRRKGRIAAQPSASSQDEARQYRRFLRGGG